MTGVVTRARTRLAESRGQHLLVASLPVHVNSKLPPAENDVRRHVPISQIKLYRKINDYQDCWSRIYRSKHDEQVLKKPTNELFMDLNSCFVNPDGFKVTAKIRDLKAESQIRAQDE